MTDPTVCTRVGTAAAAALLTLLAACGGKEPAPPDAATAGAPAAPAAPATSEEAPAPVQASSDTWSPEALEELLAPVALYPDPVLAQVLVASTNPQEVLDAGNWLIANPDLSGDALDEAAETAGFTPPIRGLIQSPEVIDQMCLNLDWTGELGQAYVNDQAGVMDAVQRLRAQAQGVGTLASSDKMQVETEEQEGEQVIVISPPSQQVVYVPQYDPVAAYAPPPAAAAPAAAPATTTTTTEDKGHSTGSLIATGVLAFGAGILVNEIFEDDDDDYWNSSYYGNMWYRPMPPYPPYPYRPAYGGGFYPSHGYNRPPTYIRDNNVVVVNQNNDYWNRYDNKTVNRSRAQPKSPITAAKPNRPELTQLNAEARNGPRRPAPTGTDAWKGQKAYAGADPQQRAAVQSKAATGKAKVDAAPKVQGSYAGARPSGAKADTSRTRVAEQRPTAAPATARPAATAKPAAASKVATVDRGRATQAPASRPAASTQTKAAAPPAPVSKTAVSGARSGTADRAASSRGRQSAPQGVPANAKREAAARRSR